MTGVDLCVSDLADDLVGTLGRHRQGHASGPAALVLRWSSSGGGEPAPEAEEAGVVGGGGLLLLLPHDDAEAAEADQRKKPHGANCVVVVVKGVVVVMGVVVRVAVVWVEVGMVAARDAQRKVGRVGYACARGSTGGM